MAHLLMIESWVGGTGRIFPQTIAGAGHQYTFVTRNRAHYSDGPDAPAHPVLAHAANVLVTETNDVAALTAFLRAQHRLLRFDGVVTICDYYIDTVAQVARALELPQAYPDNVAAVRRKHLVRAALERAGLPNPAYRVVDSWPAAREAATQIGYPLVLKPSDLASSAFVRLVHDEAGLHAAFAALEAFPVNFREQAREPMWLLEEYMTGEEISVEACTHGGVTTIVGITDKSVTGQPYFIEDGHMFPARLDEDVAAAARALVTAALQAVGFDHGISHTEVKLTPRGPRIVEINPRPGGNYIAELIERVTGIGFLAAQVDLALGRRPDLTPRDTGVRSAAIRFLVPPRAGRLQAMTGQEQAAAAPHVVRASFGAWDGRELPAPVDNACYLGHVIAVDPLGLDARAHADAALAQVRLRYAEQAGPVADAPADVAALLAAVQDGAFGADPATLHVTGAAWIAQSTRFPGTAQTYRNYYLLLRVGAAFGACCVEAADLDADIAPALAGATVATLLRDDRLPVRIAALDAYLNAVAPQREAADAQVLMLPAGAPPLRAMARDQAIASLVPIAPGQRVGLIGVVNPLVEAIERQGGICLPCDFNMTRTQGGLEVVRDMGPVLEQADIVIATGMTLSNGSFDTILAAARRRAIPLIVFAQTGSGIVPRFLGHGVTAVCAEPFPFSQFSAEPTPVFLHRRNAA
ncbi:ATP-grasp domain-containing protein [Pseudoduganella chitinolytica]|uniref:ATP-grasp domain-containing protein n=1 Tax=Pseudoduganella chitinolytica TaxID=34070 RepID=A0ABY8BCR7_9BURK|nr:ATP-grasp domain-containing protein [Pseudoduganella chitinolytica]WEF33706.1 ATP-grasp domain-containing protein [Pseudoduganella chitinolytica]